MILGKPITFGSGGLMAEIIASGDVMSTDTVTATKGSKTVNGEWVSVPNPAYRNLPQGYTQVEFIQSSGTQIMDTGFKPNQDTKVEIYALNCGASQYYFGAWNTAYNNGAFAVCNDASNVYSGYDGQGGGSGTVITGNHKISIDKNIVYVDDTVFRTFTYTSFQVNYNLYLFGQNRAGTAYPLGNITLKSGKIWDNGTLVRDYVSCKNTSNEYGLYDFVTNTFFGNSGTGSFTGGDEVPQYFGCFKIKNLDLGTYTVTATRSGTSVTQSVLIDEIAQYPITISR